MSTSRKSLRAAGLHDFALEQLTVETTNILYHES